jgi:DNA polymerase-3 subunit epsilon
VSDDLSLFGDDAASAPVEPPRAPTPIADWQVDLLRKALDARGLTTMEERQQAIESAAGRTVTSLRALTHDEGMQVLSRLGQQGAPGRSTTSQWDDREGDTWIDRL